MAQVGDVRCHFGRSQSPDGTEEGGFGPLLHAVGGVQCGNP